jgi:hypothetical protein
VPAAADIADPLTLEQAFEQGRLSALESARATPAAAIVNPAAPAGWPTAARAPASATAPVSGTVLPGAPNAQLRPEASEAFENAGKWIAQPQG